MAGLIQPGDVINFARLAWDIYRLGWSDELSASTQYKDFFVDVRGLAKNLETLGDVVTQATERLRSQGAYNSEARWDPDSLYQIIGDYDATLRECYELIYSNQRYRLDNNPISNIEWNVLVQPKADALRQRIALHNSKVLQILKPFEIDLLCRVQQDIRLMHHDLAGRITAVHNDVRRMMGVIVEDLDQELMQRAQRPLFFLEVPIDLAERFRIAALKDRPEYSTDAEFQLEELSDAFVLNFRNSTTNFKPGVIVSERVPPLLQYLNLLKSIWVFKRIQVTSTPQSTNQESHWPSFIEQLGDDLSSECTRFQQELVAPPLNSTVLRGDVFSVWPERDPVQLVDVFTRDEMMIQLQEVPLQGVGVSVERKVKLLKRLGADGRRFRIIIHGTEQNHTGRARRETEVIDFDITSVIINPIYAIPSSGGNIQELILRRDERIARMTFTKMSHILKFQQAVTGYKPYDGYCQYNVLVSFIVVGQKEPLCERASLQLWIPKEVEGSLITTNDAATEPQQPSPPSRTGSIAISGTSTLMGGSPSIVDPSRSRSTDHFSQSPPGYSFNLPPIPQGQSPSPNMFSTSWPRQGSPSPLGGTPPDRQGFHGATLQSPARRPVGAPPSPRRPVSQSTFNTRSGPNGRSLSMSSAISTAVSTTSNSSSSDGRTTISRGTNTTGYVHRRPSKPLLVLFTQNPQTGGYSFVTIQIDEETCVNPDRCDCRRSGRDGMSCTIAAIEKRRGDSHIAARRFKGAGLPNQELDWNLSRLAINNPTSTSDTFNINKLTRVSIMFPDPMARAKFGGTPLQCQCRNLNQGELANCLNAGHRGLWGKVQETYRRQVNAYHQTRYGAQKHVVNGLMSD